MSRSFAMRSLIKGWFWRSVIGLGGEAFSADLAAAGIGMREFLRLVTTKAVLLHAIAGVLMPTWMVVMLTRFFGPNRSWSEGLSVLPFTLLGGLDDARAVAVAHRGVPLQRDRLA